MRRAGHRSSRTQDHEPQREGHGGCTGPARAAESRTQPGNALGRVRHGASGARVQSGRSWYAAASEQHAPAQTVAAVLGVLGTRAQHARRAHACLPALRADMPRDRNSATVALIDALDTQNTPGTGVAARPKPLPRQRGKSRSVTRETPTTTPCVERRESSWIWQQSPHVGCAHGTPRNQPMRMLRENQSLAPEEVPATSAGAGLSFAVLTPPASPCVG